MLDEAVLSYQKLGGAKEKNGENKMAQKTIKEALEKKSINNISVQKYSRHSLLTQTQGLKDAGLDISNLVSVLKDHGIKSPQQHHCKLLKLDNFQQKKPIKNHKLQLSKEQMRDYGYKVIDHLVEHFDKQADKSPVCMASHQQMEALLYEEIPQQPTDAQEVLNHVMDNVLSNCGLHSHPRSFSCVPGPSNFISAMADALASGFNVFSGSWKASPAATEIEIMVINWLLEMFGFSIKKGGGLFTSGGSMANLTALATARQIKCSEDFSNAMVYLSDQAHSSNIKALRILGFKKQQIRIISTSSDFKISLSKLTDAIANDKLNKLQPFCLIASVGTTNTGTVDPISDLVKICKAENMWLHVDAAYGGAAILASNGKQLLEGVESADSLTVDPHKWFYQPYEMGCLLVKDQRWLTRTFTEKPEYLRDLESSDSEINYFDQGIQLTRNFKALKLYMSIKTFGLDSFKQAVQYNINLTEKVEQILRESKNWEIISPASLAVINFRYNPSEANYCEQELDKINQSASRHVMAKGFASLTTTMLNNQVVLRMCLINPRTTLKDVTDTLKICESFADLNS